VCCTVAASAVTKIVEPTQVSKARAAIVLLQLLRAGWPLDETLDMRGPA
jgi:hypothetical protein